MSANEDFTNFMGTETGQAWLKKNYKTNKDLNQNELRIGQSPDARDYTPVNAPYYKSPKVYTGLQPQETVTPEQKKNLGWGRGRGGNRKSKKNKKTEKRKTGKGKISKTGKGKISKTRSIRKSRKKIHRKND